MPDVTMVRDSRVTAATAGSAEIVPDTGVCERGHRPACGVCRDGKGDYRLLSRFITAPAGSHEEVGHGTDGSVQSIRRDRRRVPCSVPHSSR